jgi:hypothetical protein
MKNTSRFSFGLLALAVLVLAPAARAQSAPEPAAIPIDVELGYRFVDVSGNEQMYRSQIDDRQGLLLRSLTLDAGTAGFGGLFDTFRVDAGDLGAGPSGVFRLDAGKTGAYRLRFDYRRMELYSALPAFANPLLADGILPGQHTSDRVRNMFGVELELLPGGAITPIVGYTRNRYEGPGRTTYHVGGDEFLLSSDLDDTDQEVHAGAAFHFGPIAGRILQGWRKFTGRESLSLAPGGGDGNNSGTVLGVPVSATSFSRDTHNDVNTPMTTAFVTGQVSERFRLVGSYVRASAESDTNESEDLAGQFVSFELSRFFGGLSETASARSRAKDWTAGGRAEVNLADGIDLLAGYTRRHRDLDGFALISTLYLDTLNFAGQDPRDLLNTLEANTSLERTEKLYEVSVTAKRFGPLAIRAGWSMKDQDITVSPDPSEIVVPGNQGGSFSRRVRGLDGGATYSLHGLTLGADYRRERADQAVVRTDFLDRDRYRLRAAWNPGERFGITTTAEQIDSSNDETGIGATGRFRQYGGDVEGEPVKNVRLRFSAEKFESDSKIPIREPQNFETERSLYKENGRFLEGGLRLILAPVTVEGSYGQYRNRGTFGFTIDRAAARGEVEFTKALSAIAEWRNDRYRESSQDSGGVGNYKANRYGFYLRWRQ